MENNGERNAMQLFEGYEMKEKTRITERGELLEYFSAKLLISIPYVARKVQGLDLKTLYYMKSAADSYEKQGNPWAKGFYGMLKVH